jgi:uncharacterized membrane protein
LRHSLTIARLLQCRGAPREVDDVSEASEQPLGQVLVSANSSLTRQGALLFFGVTAGISLLIAGLLAARGFWPVLPFAGLELFVLGLALGVSQRRGRYREFVSIYPDRIVIETGVGAVEERFELPRTWTRLELVPARWHGHPSRLLLACHGKRWEIGAVLTEAERESLRARLAELIAGPERSTATEQRPAANDFE